MALPKTSDNPCSSTEVSVSVRKFSDRANFPSLPQFSPLGVLAPGLPALYHSQTLSAISGFTEVVGDSPLLSCTHENILDSG